MTIKIRDIIALVVQWIERLTPNELIRVRLTARAQNLMERFTPKENTEVSKDFRTKKSTVLDFLNREKTGEDVGIGFDENTGTIDENIHELIEQLNRLPFLYTTGCCGGHVFKREATRTAYTSGDVHSRVDGSLKSLEFVRELSKIVEKFEGADFFKPGPDHFLPYIVQFGKNFGKKRIDTATAIKMENEREKLKGEILELTIKFQS